MHIVAWFWLALATFTAKEQYIIFTCDVSTLARVFACVLWGVSLLVYVEEIGWSSLRRWNNECWPFSQERSSLEGRVLNIFDNCTPSLCEEVQVLPKETWMSCSDLIIGRAMADIMFRIFNLCRKAAATVVLYPQLRNDVWTYPVAVWRACDTSQVLGLNNEIISWSV